MTLTPYNIEALCKTYGYQSQIKDDKGELVDNPQTQAEFAIIKVLDFVNDVTVAYHINKKITDAKTLAEPEAKALDKPTM